MVIRREMEVCPHCGALESSKIHTTRRDKLGNVIRYRKCKACGSQMAAELLLVPKKGEICPTM